MLCGFGYRCSQTLKRLKGVDPDGLLPQSLINYLFIFNSKGLEFLQIYMLCIADPGIGGV